MKKVINLKEIMIVTIMVLIITFSINVFALDLNSVVGPDEYENALQVPEDTNNTTNNTANNTTNNTANNTANNTTNNTTNNTVKKYNTNNTTDLPQTGIEDYNVGILLIICVASAIFAYKKVSDYRNI